MKSEASKALVGSFVLVGSQIIGRLLGLVSTLVLARVLLPADFGIIAIAMIVINFFELLVVTGTSQYIIQKEQVDDDDLNTSWTLDICLKLVVTSLLFLLAPYAADFYGDQRLEPVLSTLCFMIAIGTFSNPEQNLHRRAQKYNVIFLIDLLRKGLSVPVTIGLAITLESYWAIVFGHCFSAIILLVASYVLMPYRPRFTLVKVKEQFTFSKWLMLKGIIGYCRGQMDTFLVSKYFGVSQVGAYHIMKYVGTMPESQIINPATQPLLATFSRNKNDKIAMLYQFHLAFLVLAIIAVPLTIYVFEYSYQLVALLLGEQWIPYHKVFGYLTLLTGSLAIGNISSQILVSKGKVKYLFYYDIITLMLMLSVLYSVKGIPIEDFTLSRVGVDFFITISLFVFVVKALLKSSLMPALRVLTVLLPSAYVIVQITSILTQFIVSDFLHVLVSSCLFGVLWSVILIFLYKLHWHKTEEGRHLAFILNSAFLHIKDFILNRIKRPLV